jgi:hypothetical protein
MTLLHWLSYLGGVAAFLFVTLSLGECRRLARGTSAIMHLEAHIVPPFTFTSEWSIMAGGIDRRALQDGQDGRPPDSLRAFSTVVCLPPKLSAFADLVLYHPGFP